MPNVVEISEKINTMQKSTFYLLFVHCP